MWSLTFLAHLQDGDSNPVMMSLRLIKLEIHFPYSVCRVLRSSSLYSQILPSSSMAQLLFCFIFCSFPEVLRVWPLFKEGHTRGTTTKVPFIIQIMVFFLNGRCRLYQPPLFVSLRSTDPPRNLTFSCFCQATSFVSVCLV